MPLKIFMRDGDELLTYGGILEFVNSAKSYRPAVKPKSLLDFLKNFALNLSFGKNFSIIDSDLSDAETALHGIENPELELELDGREALKSTDELLERIKNSQSKITIFTSGTTGRPKKVSHTIKTLSRQVRQSPDYADHVWGFAYSPTHMAGLQVILQILFNQNSATNIFMKPKSFIYENIRLQKISHISASPTFYRLMLPQNAEYPSVKRISLGGEKSNSKLYDALRKTFPNAKINNIYASTECGGLLASSGEFFTIPKELSELVIIKDGELLVRKELLGDTEDLAPDGDFYKTGDLVEFKDAEKTSFRFSARKDNIVNVGGHKVSLEEVEDKIRQIPQVCEACVYARKNSVLGNILCATITLNIGSPLTEAELRKILSADLQDFKIPRKIQFTDKPETTQNGKLKRS